MCSGRIHLPTLVPGGVTIVDSEEYTTLMCSPNQIDGFKLARDAMLTTDAVAEDTRYRDRKLTPLERRRKADGRPLDDWEGD